jgi:3-deoxy-D-manno-octulosonic-acid transferase
LKNFPDLLLILAPRHPERFSKVKTLIKNSSFNLISRKNYEKKAHNEVFLLDTMGEVTLFFAASDISFIGGSLVPIGGHNILEPAIQGLPIIVGPYFSNSEEVVNEFIKDDACLIAKNEVELAENISSLLCDSVKAKKMGQRSLRLIRKNKGSIERLLHLLNPILKV